MEGLESSLRRARIVRDVTALREISRSLSFIVGSWDAIFNRSVALFEAGDLNGGQTVLEDALKGKVTAEAVVVEGKRRKLVASHVGSGLSKAEQMARLLVSCWDGWPANVRQCVALLGCCYAVKKERQAAQLLFGVDRYAWTRDFEMYCSGVVVMSKGKDLVGASLCFEKGDYSRCLSLLDGLDTHEAHALAGAALLAMGSPREATARLGRSVQDAARVDQCNVNTVHNLVVALQRAGEGRETILQASVVLYDACVETGAVTSSCVAMGVRVARMLRVLQRPEEACSFYESVLVLGGVVGAEYVECLIDMGRLQDALTLLNRLSTKQPDLLHLRLECLVRLQQVEPDIDLSPLASGDSLVLGNAALYAMASEKQDPSYALLRQARELDPKSILLAYNQTLMLLKRGRKSEAVQLWSSFRTLKRSERSLLVDTVKRAGTDRKNAMFTFDLLPEHLSQLDLIILDEPSNASTLGHLISTM